MSLEFISLLLGSRARPIFLQTMWDQFRSAANNPDYLELIVYIDDDDIETQNLQLEGNVVKLIRPRCIMSDMTNKCFEQSKKEIVGLFADDLRYEGPQGWDDKIRQVFSLYKDRIVLAYTSDGYHGSSFSTHPFISGNAVKVMGKVCPLFSHSYVDTYLWDIFTALNRTYYLPISTPHLHHSFGKRDFDNTDAYQKENFNRERPDLKYLGMGKEKMEDINKLKRYIEDVNN